MIIPIAICDDEATETKYLKDLVLGWAKKEKRRVKVTTFDSAEAFLFAYEADKTFDVLLLDIQMKHMDGISLARQLREKGNDAQIVFITGFSEYMAQGYDVSALHYLMKPIKEDKLYEVLSKAYEERRRSEKSLFLTVNGEMYRIPVREIRFIEAQGHYVIIKTVSDEYKVKKNLFECMEELGVGFFRCQRSFIVNLVYVRKITRTALVLDNETEIPLSRNLYHAANQAIIDFF